MSLDDIPFPTTTDRLLGGRVMLRQPEKGYRSAIDPVLLAAAVDAPEGARIVDIGAGAGQAALCLAARRPDLHIAALELQAPLARLARENAGSNGMEVEVVEGDLHGEPPPFGGARFDVAITNPPFWRAGESRPSPDPVKRIATIEGPEGLTGWMLASARLLTSSGRLLVIHSSARLGDVLAGGRHAGFRAIAVFPLWPKAGEKAKRVIVALDRHGPENVRRSEGLVLHDGDGRYTAETECILRDGIALSAITDFGNPV
ncbi:MAG: methyltransferase [Rhodospirillales bacterium]